MDAALTLACIALVSNIATMASALQRDTDDGKALISLLLSIASLLLVGGSLLWFVGSINK